MSRVIPSPPSPDKPLSRQALLALLEAALAVSEPRYARRAALAWLSSFPGDLEINLRYARALELEGLYRQAELTLVKICQVDPEFLEAQELLLRIQQLSKTARVDKSENGANACVAALGGAPANRAALPKWAPLLHAARRSLSPKNGLSAKNAIPSSEESFNNNASDLIHQVLLEQPANPLVALTHLKIIAANPQMPIAAVQSLSETYHERFPECLVFSLALADVLMDSGQTERAVALLHHASAQDVAGQVSARLWGADHPYLALWPERLEFPPDTPNSPQQISIPAAVAAALGWNQLPQGNQALEQNPTTEESAATLSAATPPASQVELSKANPSTAENSQTPASVPAQEVPSTLQAEVETIAQQLHKPGLGNMDGRYPLYVIFTTQSGLEKQYGAQASALLDLSMRRLVEAIARQKRWGAMLYYADRPEMGPSIPALGLKPANPSNAWEMKLALADLDAALGKRGEMIGAVLIVGGAEIVPFHRLPNPVDDSDMDVPSDNPYTARDENYFIPEWPLGRLPGGSGNDPQPLLQALESLIENYNTQRPKPFYQRWWEELRSLVDRLLAGRLGSQHSLGYSAAIWRRASISVFRPIGEPRALLVSPPMHVDPACQPGRNGREACLPLPRARLAYFNLHGLADTTAWYGQRDPTEPGNDPDFPLALRPEDISANGLHASGSVPEVIFSEACYGAQITSQAGDQTIALKFLSCGSRALVGSTCISYGAVAAPLSAADLLGRSFWNFLQEGHPTGEALRRAKISLAREMYRRQGYLDGEDQKTLISFVLYGDPLAQVQATQRGAKTILRPLSRPSQVPTVCDRSTCDQPGCNPDDRNQVRQSQIPETVGPIPPEVLVQVKHIVHQYLPGMANAQLTYSQEHAGCDGATHHCPSSQLGAKGLPERPPQRQVVMLSKTIHQSQLTHQQYARLTLDVHGKLVKLVVSR